MAFNAICYLGISQTKQIDKALVGMYESTNSSEWVRLNANGTGKLCITSDWLDLGCPSFTWHSDRDQIFIEFNPNETIWFSWILYNGVINIDISRMGQELHMIKTE